MNKWKEVVEDGHVFYVGDKATIAKLTDGVFVTIMPATARLGPFDSLEQAQQVAEQNEQSLRKYLESFNDHLMALSAAVQK